MMAREERWSYAEKVEVKFQGSDFYWFFGIAGERVKSKKIGNMLFLQALPGEEGLII